MSTDKMIIKKLKAWSIELLGIIDYLDKKSIIYGVGQMQALREEMESELSVLESSPDGRQEDETILVDDSNYPNMGRRITRKEYEAQFKVQSSEPDKQKVSDEDIE